MHFEKVVYKDGPGQTIIKEVPVEVIKEVRKRLLKCGTLALVCHRVSTATTTRVCFSCRSSSRRRTR